MSVVCMCWYVHAECLHNTSISITHIHINTHLVELCLVPLQLLDSTFVLSSLGLQDGQPLLQVSHFIRDWSIRDKTLQQVQHTRQIQMLVYVYSSLTHSWCRIGSCSRGSLNSGNLLCLRSCTLSFRWR